jgi:hypothetical protein
LMFPNPLADFVKEMWVQKVWLLLILLS